MNVFIQLISAGTHTGSFSLYSDVDGYFTAFQTNISRNKLLSGFLSVLVPANTTIIRIQSEEDCDTYIDITIGLTPTTTTTTTLFPPTTTTTTTVIPLTTTTTTTGSETIGEPCPQTETGIFVTLNSSHTYPTFIVDFGEGATGTINTIVEPYTNTPNRFTIRNYYDNNIVYTTGWVGYATYPGPWGMTLSNPAPATSPLTLANRYYRFEVETVTGPTYTDAWQWDVPCSDVTTTTTSTTALPIQTMLIARAASGTAEVDGEGLCGNLYNVEVDVDTVQVVYFKSASTIPDDSIIQQPLFIDYACTITFDDSDGTWWGAITDWNLVSKNTYDYAIVISSPPGLVTLKTMCTTTTTTTSP